MALGPAEVLVVVAYVVVALVCGVRTALDASRQPAAAFEQIGTTKGTWIALPLMGVVFCGFVAIIAAYIWFTQLRSAVVAAAGG